MSGQRHCPLYYHRRSQVLLLSWSSRMGSHKWLPHRYHPNRPRSVQSHFGSFKSESVNKQTEFRDSFFESVATLRVSALYQRAVFSLPSRSNLVPSLLTSRPPRPAFSFQILPKISQHSSPPVSPIYFFSVILFW